MVRALLQHIRIVLVEPAGALNVGSAARVMANMGLSQLVLVNPHCDPLGAEARRMAVHAVEILERAIAVPTLPEALTGCTRAIATTARDRAFNTEMELPEVALPWLVPAAPTASVSPAALIFGPEDRGLSNAELNYAQRFVRIPSDADYPSMNLAQAIAVCCYELARAAVPRQTADNPPPRSLPERASMEQLEGFYQHLQSVLLKIGYLYPHTAVSRMEKFRRFFLRAAPTSQELAMLRGILRQTDWAVDQSLDSASPPTDIKPPDATSG